MKYEDLFSEDNFAYLDEYGNKKVYIDSITLNITGSQYRQFGMAVNNCYRLFICKRQQNINSGSESMQIITAETMVGMVNSVTSNVFLNNSSQNTYIEFKVMADKIGKIGESEGSGITNDLFIFYFEDDDIYKAKHIIATCEYN